MNNHASVLTHPGWIHAALVLVLLSGFLPDPVLARDSNRTNVMVLDFELRDLTIHDSNAGEVKRTENIRPVLEQALATMGDLQVIELDPVRQQQADRGRGYLYDRPELAARLGREARADWVVVGRVHKPSFLFLYLQAHLVDVSNSRLAAALSVEVKGLDERFVKKGVQRLAGQISESIEYYRQ